MRDSASLPENITGTWQVWNQADGKWMAAEGVKVLAVGNSQVNVSGATPAACNMHTDKLGDFERLKGQETLTPTPTPTLTPTPTPTLTLTRAQRVSFSGSRTRKGGTQRTRRHPTYY